jgi:hypothetical protein
MMDLIVGVIAVAGFLLAGTFVLGALRIWQSGPEAVDKIRRAGFDLEAWRTGEMSEASKPDLLVTHRGLDIVATADGFDVRPMRTITQDMF